MEIVDLPRKYVTPALFVGYTLASLHLVLTFGADVVAHFWIRTLCYQVSGTNQGCTTLAEVASPVLTVMWYAMLMSFAIFLVDSAAEVIRDLAHYGEAGPLTEPSSDTPGYRSRAAYWRYVEQWTEVERRVTPSLIPPHHIPPAVHVILLATRTQA